MQKAEKRLVSIMKRARHSGLSSELIIAFVSEEFANLSKQSKYQTKNINGKTYPSLTFLTAIRSKISKKNLKSLFLVFLVVVLILFKIQLKKTLANSECFMSMPFDETKVFRKPEDCSFCNGVTSVDRVSNISHVDFQDFYASPARPVIITDGTKDWTAPQLFNFKYFKELYQKYDDGTTVCQFFPYKTEFDSLRKVLNMSEARSRLEPGTKEWYIGWSNCNDQAGQELRRHYKRPYFLPDTSENLALSWIFMGGPGEGAHMHVDNVHYASWQAQLRGRKKWRLAPPPECYYACVEFAAIVEPGEIIVVDTNRWYHQTHILPGDISITIGAEFD